MRAGEGREREGGREREQVEKEANAKWTQGKESTKRSR